MTSPNLDMDNINFDDYENQQTPPRLAPVERTTQKDASEQYIGYLYDLSVKHDWQSMYQSMPDAWKRIWNDFLDASQALSAQEIYDTHRFAQSTISTFITQIKKQPLLEQDSYQRYKIRCEDNGIPSSHQPMVNNKQPLQDGMYRGPNPNNHIYKVYHTVHGANQQVTKRLVVTEEIDDYNIRSEEANTVTVSFKYEGKAPLAFLKPSMRLTTAEAMAFGRLYGACCICGKTLTNELSIHLGIGPVCGGREFSGEFQFIVDQAKL